MIIIDISWSKNVSHNQSWFDDPLTKIYYTKCLSPMFIPHYCWSLLLCDSPPTSQLSPAIHLCDQQQPTIAGESQSRFPGLLLLAWWVRYWLFLEAIFAHNNQQGSPMVVDPNSAQLLNRSTQPFNSYEPNIIISQLLISILVTYYRRLLFSLLSNFSINRPHC